MFLTALPVFLVNGSPDAGPAALTRRDLLGLAMWLLGFCMEVAADRQKACWADKSRFIDTGLWALSGVSVYVSLEYAGVDGLALLRTAGMDGYVKVEGWTWSYAWQASYCSERDDHTAHSYRVLTTTTTTTTHHHPPPKVRGHGGMVNGGGQRTDCRRHQRR